MTIRDTSGNAVVVLRGELDIATLDDARRQIEAVEAGDTPCSCSTCPA